jgi:hypothetical protein
MEAVAMQTGQIGQDTAGEGSPPPTFCNARFRFSDPRIGTPPSPHANTAFRSRKNVSFAIFPGHALRDLTTVKARIPLQAEIHGSIIQQY